MLSAALGHIQSLHAQANALQDSNTRTMYLKELESVSGLLPYHDPKLSPVAYYLDEKRRDTLAEAVNGAILCESRCTERIRSVRVRCGRDIVC